MRLTFQHSPSVSNRAVPDSHDPTGAVSALALRGTITAYDLAHLAGELDRVMRSAPGTVIVDLSRLTGWSLIAQAMLLSTDRTMARNGGRLVLLNPSPGVVAQAAMLDLFGRVSSRTSATWETSTGHVDPDVALLVVDADRLLTVRTAARPALRLPGGPTLNGGNPRRVLARHLAGIGIHVDEQQLVRSPKAPSLVSHDSGVAAETLCFEAPLADPNGLGARESSTSGRAVEHRASSRRTRPRPSPRYITMATSSRKPVISRRSAPLGHSAYAA